MNSIKCIAVIPSIEGWHLLNRLLPTIDLPKEQILVIDQGSKDGTEKKCLEQGYGCVQMHTRATFTEAVNRGIREALDRQADYVLILNNDIEFLTHVASQLIQRAENEVSAGVIAPRQIIVENDQKTADIKRGYWQLSTFEIAHEFDVYKDELNNSNNISQNDPEVLEADFCEFTCALVKASVFKTVGLLDEKYQFYHEDADFCFRCQIAGFRCIYDQTALIKHYTGSTFSKQKNFRKEKLIARNKAFFAADHLKNHVYFPSVPKTIACSWATTNEFLYLYLNKYGLMSCNSDVPMLSGITHPEMVDSDYLLTVWETSQIPHSWLAECKKFKHIFVPSGWNKEVFEKSGFKNVSILPFGVETDLFHPWGQKLSFPWEKSLLCVFQHQHRKALDVTLKMWNQVRPGHPGVFLVMYGKDIDSSKLEITHKFGMRIGNFIAKIDWDRKIALLEPAFRESVSHEDMATLYRSCEFYLLNSRSEGFGYPILEAMACGSTCIIPNYGAAKEFIKEGNCIAFEGTPIQADYSDKCFKDVGHWWEPDLKDLCSKVERALRLDESARSQIGHLARQSVVSNYTWRHSMMALRRELQTIQSPSGHQFKPEKKRWVRHRRKAAILLNMIGKNFIKVGAVIQQKGFRTTASKIALKAVNTIRKKVKLTG